MNIREAAKELEFDVEAGNTVIYEGPSGIAKSTMMLTKFAKLQASTPPGTWGLGYIFGATQTPSDVIGLQFKGQRTVGDKTFTISDPSCPLWALSVPFGDDPGGKPMWCYKHFYLVVDEYGQTEGDTKRSLAEICLNKGTPPHFMPEGSVVVMATNVGSRYGVSKDFLFCISRRKLVRVVPNVDIWDEDFASKPYYRQGKEWQVMPLIRFFAKQRPDVVMESEPKEDVPWCNFRTLCDVDRYLQCKMRTNGGEIPTDPLTTESIAGYIGMPATSALVEKIIFRTQLMPYEDVLADPDNAPVPKTPDMQMLAAYEYASQTKHEDLATLLRYIKRLPQKDMVVPFITSLLKRDYSGFINLPAMQGWIAKNATMVALCASLEQNQR